MLRINKDRTADSCTRWWGGGHRVAYDLRRNGFDTTGLEPRTDGSPMATMDCLSDPAGCDAEMLREYEAVMDGCSEPTPEQADALNGL